MSHRGWAVTYWTMVVLAAFAAVGMLVPVGAQVNRLTDITVPIPIEQGGTGSATLADAQAALGISLSPVDVLPTGDDEMDFLRGGSTRTWFELLTAAALVRPDRMGANVGGTPGSRILYDDGEWKLPFEFPTTVSGRNFVLDSGSQGGGNGLWFVVSTVVTDEDVDVSLEVTVTRAASDTRGNCQVAVSRLGGGGVYGLTEVLGAGDTSNTVTITVTGLTFITNSNTINGSTMKGVGAYMRSTMPNWDCQVEAGAKLTLSY